MMIMVVQEEVVPVREEADQVVPQADVADAAAPGINFCDHIYKQ